MEYVYFKNFKIRILKFPKNLLFSVRIIFYFLWGIRQFTIYRNSKIQKLTSLKNIKFREFENSGFKISRTKIMVVFSVVLIFR